jgi:DNA-directed RNA polymerase specialized sigma24 family protein
MADVCGPLAPELRGALKRMIDKATGRPGKQMACKTIQREAEIWPQVQRMLAEARANTGESKEFDRLWRMIRREVRATILASSRRKTDEVVDEVEQRSGVEIFLKRLAYSIEKGTFLVWVRAIARNLARWNRDEAPQSPPSEEDGGAVEDKTIPPSKCFEELLRWIQEREPHQANVFLLHKYLDWSLDDIDEEFGGQFIAAIAARVVLEIRQNVEGLEDVDTLFARLHVKAAALGEVRLKELYGNERPKAALGHWCSSIARWMRSRMFRSAKRLLKCISDLRAGAHERLTFLWSRFLRRTLESLPAREDGLLADLLAEFRTEFPKMSDLTQAEVEECTETIYRELLPRTLEQSSSGVLAEDLVAWRERVQQMSAKKCMEGVVAYAYLCGALPGITGPAKGGVA